MKARTATLKKVDTAFTFLDSMNRHATAMFDAETDGKRAAAGRKYDKAALRLNKKLRDIHAAIKAA